MKRLKKWIRVYAKVTALLDKCLVDLRKKQVKRQNFSIICNNCWGGYVYRRYRLPYLSPTIGLYFFAEDFVKMCSDLKKYMNAQLEFIPLEESKYKDELIKRNQVNVPIARLRDIEVVFLHYSSEKEAEEKWNRRVKRINYDNLIIKFSKMNLCTEHELVAFDQLKFNKKICFVPPEDCGLISCGIPFKSAAGKIYVENDSNEYGRYINLTRLINAKLVCGNHME